MVRLKLPDLSQDDIGDKGLRADGRGVPESSMILDMGIRKTLFPDIVGQPEQNRNIFVRVESIGDEKWHDNDVGAIGQGSPILDERRLLHQDGLTIGVEAASPDDGGLFMDDLGRVIVERGSVTADEEAGRFRWIGNLLVRGDDHLLGATQESLGHGGVKADRGTIEDILMAKAGHRPAESQFPGNHLLREVAGADEIGNGINRGAVRLAQGLPEIGFLLPEGDMDFGKNSPSTDFLGVLVGGGA